MTAEERHPQGTLCYITITQIYLERTNTNQRTNEPTNQQSFKVVLGVGRIGIRKNWGEFATKGPTRITPE
ncbi:hypothetical protein CFAM422_006621 [Trichoderma lentiforme]|uniref:Uncharacterized protein n=1 Tax=Trichoderma lentiforme TaxID=1567552 RepID=A0A9P4XEQ5_9HYPO|nr:hypothetical protein CFAM422_006621 [Trichoderma lentiforme]